MKKIDQQQPEWLTIVTVNDGTLTTQERLYWRDKLIEEMREYLDGEYGAGNWTIVPTAELPTEFTPETFTIVDGVLVPAPEEVLAARRTVAEHADLRIEREKLLKQLADTDFNVNKFVEEALSEENFAPVREARRGFRARINEIEAILGGE